MSDKVVPQQTHAPQWHWRHISTDFYHLTLSLSMPGYDQTITPFKVIVSQLVLQKTLNNTPEERLPVRMWIYDSSRQWIAKVMKILEKRAANDTKSKQKLSKVAVWWKTGNEQR